MRSQTLPPKHLTRLVYDEAAYLSFDQLSSRLAITRTISGGEVKDTFLSTIPNYYQNFNLILDIGKRLALENGGSRKSKVSKSFTISFCICRHNTLGPSKNETPKVTFFISQSDSVGQKSRLSGKTKS